MKSKNDKKDVDVDVTKEENTVMDEMELEDIEDREEAKIKKLREKLKLAEEDKKKAMDELQLARADFLNARKRLEEERARDRVRSKKQHIENLLPLADSFQMAMSNKEIWEKADSAWRKGIEGIHTQLQNILKDAGVKVVDPTGESFDPTKHEAVGTEVVTDKKLDDTVVTVIQSGYEITHNGKTELIRPARVTTGKFE